ncbi:MAG: tRNA guanosine(15) transglycosylase TgtA [Thermoplasmata archaeon]|nr:tRNA guanosine(15) transglycosylase TgtA [Thermoplasmata archaeon]
MFELKHRDGLARIGILETAHGKIETPTLLPVINPNQITVSPAEMKEKVGIQALITNSYIIRKHDNLRELALEKGLHELVGFNGPIMTDSGTFQSHMYGEVELEPLEIIEFQKAIGSDIGTVLDIFSEPEDKREKVERDLKTTIERTQLSADNKGNMMLAGPIQGGRFPDLREYAAQEMSKMDCDIFPIGGVVPMMEKQMYFTLVDAVLSAKKHLNPSVPVHLFGCGHPMLFSMAALMGCDMVDSAAYAKFARDGRMMFSDGTRFLKDIKELPCHCPICSTHTADELRDSPDQEKLLAEHNLYVSFTELKIVKQAIHEGRIWELTETRARAHPNLLDGLKCFRKHTELLEKTEPLSRDLAYLYTSPESYYRPIVSRLKNRILERYEQPVSNFQVLFPEATKPYYRSYGEQISKMKDKNTLNYWIDSFFCPIPVELDEMYPISQSVISERLEPGIEQEKMRVLKEFMDAGLISPEIKHWHGKETIESIPQDKADNSEINIARVKAVADIQFGKGAGKALLDGEIELVLSAKTDRIRNVRVNNQHVLSMRAGDGLFTLKIAGAQILQQTFPSPKMRVIVNPDSAEFNRKGKSVFSAFVLDADPDIVPGDEVLIVDEKDDLCAVGRTIMTRNEMLAFNNGTAVKVREGQNHG